MTTVVKRQSAITVPAAVQRRAGFKTGDVLEFKASGGVITIRPKIPSAADEYTQQQRGIIDAELDKAEKGPVHGPFDGADDMIAHIKRELRKRASLKKRNRSR